MTALLWLVVGRVRKRGRGTFTASAGGVVRRVEIACAFSSFADGSTVTATLKVDRIQVASGNFTWDGNGVAIRMKLRHNAANVSIDNLTISTIPKPAGAALAGLRLLGLVLRRRR